MSHTETLASVDRFLKIERINCFLQSKRYTLTFLHGGINFPIISIDAQGHVIGEEEDTTYCIELSYLQLEALFAFVVEHEVET